MSRGVVDFGSNLMLTKICHYFGVQPLLNKQVCLEVALPARVNKVDREFASMDLVDGYWVAYEFVKTLFNASSSVI